MKISILVEDKSNKLPGEHGLSVYFEKENKFFLFDTGNTYLFLKNAEKLGLDIYKTDYIVLSHGHYDHTGGLEYLKEDFNPAIIGHPNILENKYIGKRYIGMPVVRKKIRFIKDFTEIENDIFFLGEIPEDCPDLTNGRRSLGTVNNEPDLLYDDTALCINRADDIIVLAGCSHSGIINIIDYVLKKIDNKNIIIIGGLHLTNHNAAEIQTIANILRKKNVVAIYPGHCTGNNACKILLQTISSGKMLYSGLIIDI